LTRYTIALLAPLPDVQDRTVAALSRPPTAGGRRWSQATDPLLAGRPA